MDKEAITGLVKLTGALAGSFTLLASAYYAVSPRITEREAGLKVVRGELVDSNVSHGVKLDAFLPHIQYIELPKFLQTVEVTASESDALSIRTMEKARIYGTFKIKFTIDNTDPNFNNLYNELKADSIKDLYPHISDYTMPAAIETYRTIKAEEINDKLGEISTTMKEALQTLLNDRGYTYIKIQDVVPSGVGLSPKANSELEAIVSEQRKLDLQKVQGQVAEAAVELTQKQTAVTAEAFKALRQAGVAENDLVPAYYLQIMRDIDKVGTPGVPGPVEGTSAGIGLITTGGAPALAAPGK